MNSTMLHKKLLLLVLLIVGYGIFREEGICVISNMETKSNNCYPQTTESLDMNKIKIII